MRTALKLAGAIFTMALLSGCSKIVETGGIVTCKNCQKEISNTVTVVKVWTWEADKYHVTRSLAYCDRCGNEMVTYTVNIRCQRCGRIYLSHQEFAPRKNEQGDITKTEDFCTEECARAAQIDQTIDRVSRKTGDVVGRIGRGLFDGIKRHAP